MECGRFFIKNPGSTVADIVNAMPITEDKVRYQIKMSGDMLLKDDGRPARYTAAPIDEDIDEDIDEAPVKSDESQGDKPKRVILNPQPVINKMIATAKEAGVNMTYNKADRTWYFSKGKLSAFKKSQELPNIREKGFEKWLGNNFS